MMYTKLKIYHLVDERDGTICYVGKTWNALKDRLQHHKNEPGSQHKWQWLRNYPVSIHLALEGSDYDEAREVAKLLASGQMLFNKAPLPKMTGKERKTYRKLRAKWIEQRLQESILDNLEYEVSSFMDGLKHRNLLT